MRFLFFGDVFGKPGRQIIMDNLQKLRDEFRIDVSLMNCENLASGRGVTQKTASPLFMIGIDAFTSGNHLWDRKQSIEYIQSEPRIVKPLNFPHDAAGSSHYIIDKGGIRICVLTLVGQAFMAGADLPIQSLGKALPGFQRESDIIVVDFHAESTAEKRAMGLCYDGEIQALVGTHTHIQTADEEILPGGTAYITDVGMTGPHDSVIGVKKEIILEKMRTGMPVQYEVAESGLMINAVVFEIDEATGRAVSIERVRRSVH